MGIVQDVTAILSSKPIQIIRTGDYDGAIHMVGEMLDIALQNACPAYKAAIAVSTASGFGDQIDKAKDKIRDDFLKALLSASGLEVLLRQLLNLAGLIPAEVWEIANVDTKPIEEVLGFVNNPSFGSMITMLASASSLFSSGFETVGKALESGKIVAEGVRDVNKWVDSAEDAITDGLRAAGLGELADFITAIGVPIHVILDWAADGVDFVTSGLADAVGGVAAFAGIIAGGVGGAVEAIGGGIESIGEGVIGTGGDIIEGVGDVISDIFNL